MSSRFSRAGAFPCVLLPRTCCKCGKRFGAVDREITCIACHAPKGRQRVFTNKLTHREESIAALVAEAKSNKVIANELCLTTGTIKEYLFIIFQKLNLPNRTALAVWFLRRPPVPAEVVPH